MRIADVSFLTGYTPRQIRARCRILAESQITVCTRIKAKTRFDDFSLTGLDMLLEWRQLEEGGYSRAAAGREIIRRHKNRRATLLIPPLLAAELGCLRLAMWLFFFEGRTLAKATGSRIPVKRQIR